MGPGARCKKKSPGAQTVEKKNRFFQFLDLRQVTFATEKKSKYWVREVATENNFSKKNFDDDDWFWSVFSNAVA